MVLDNGMCCWSGDNLVMRERMIDLNLATNWFSHSSKFRIVHEILHVQINLV